MKSNEFQDTSNVFWHISNFDLTGIYYLQQNLVFKLVINNELFSDSVVYKYRVTSWDIFKQGSVIRFWYSSIFYMKLLV